MKQKVKTAGLMKFNDLWLNVSLTSLRVLSSQFTYTGEWGFLPFSPPPLRADGFDLLLSHQPFFYALRRGDGPNKCNSL
jgi:hypothetical protein